MAQNKSNKETRNETLTIRVTRTLKEGVKRRAEEERREPSDYLRLLIEDDINENKEYSDPRKVLEYMSFVSQNRYTEEDMLKFASFYMEMQFSSRGDAMKFLSLDNKGKIEMYKEYLENGWKSFIETER